jgi:hypothetical protein
MMSTAIKLQTEGKLYQRGLIYLDDIRAKLRADYAQNDSDAELERILTPCVCGHFLVPCAKELRNRGIDLVPVVDVPEPHEIDFAKECLRRGICPRCLNAGESNDRDLDLFGTCRNCG